MRYATIFIFAGMVALSGCGNRFDLNSEHGRQAAIDEANLYLSTGNCQSALEAINPLYLSNHVNDEIRIIRASADACFSGFQMIPLLVNIGDKPNYFEAITKTMNNVAAGDGKIAALYRATDIVTSNGVALSAAQRSRTLNDFMVFLQIAVMGAIQDQYGSGSSEGVQGATFNYLVAGAGTLSDVDGCAYGAAIGFVADSFSNSNLGSNAEANTALTQLNALCVAAGTTCAVINKDRTLCNGVNAASVAADALVDQANTAW